MSNGAQFTLTEASMQCKRQNASGQSSSVSRRTVQRALDKDKFRAAYRADGRQATAAVFGCPAY